MLNVLCNGQWISLEMWSAYILWTFYFNIWYANHIPLTWNLPSLVCNHLFLILLHPKNGLYFLFLRIWKKACTAFEKNIPLMALWIKEDYNSIKLELVLRVESLLRRWIRDHFRNNLFIFILCMSVSSCSLVVGMIGKDALLSYHRPWFTGLSGKYPSGIHYMKLCWENRLKISKIARNHDFFKETIFSKKIGLFFGDFWAIF